MIETTLYQTNTELGDLLLLAENVGLVEVRFLPTHHPYEPMELSTSEAAQNLQIAITALNAYFIQKKRNISVPVKLRGSEFQKKVWKSLLDIKYGTTVTYNDIAHSMRPISSAIAVGQAVAKNPLPILIPCHRVIGAKGDLVGYSGGLKRKEFLLSLERPTQYVMTE